LATITIFLQLNVLHHTPINFEFDFKAPDVVVGGLLNLFSIPIQMQQEKQLVPHQNADS